MVSQKRRYFHRAPYEWFSATHYYHRHCTRARVHPPPADVARPFIWSAVFTFLLPLTRVYGITPPPPPPVHPSCPVPVNNTSRTTRCRRSGFRIFTDFYACTYRAIRKAPLKICTYRERRDGPFGNQSSYRQTMFRWTWGARTTEKRQRFILSVWYLGFNRWSYSSFLFLDISWRSWSKNGISNRSSPWMKPQRQTSELLEIQWLRALFPGSRYIVVHTSRSVRTNKRFRDSARTWIRQLLVRIGQGINDFAKFSKNIFKDVLFFNHPVYICIVIVSRTLNEHVVSKITRLLHCRSNRPIKSPFLAVYRVFRALVFVRFKSSMSM